MLDGLTQFWSRLGTGQRTGLVAFTVVMLAGFALMAWWVSRPSFTVLYSGLSPEDAAAVVEQLRESNVPYRLTSGGTTVQVPYEKLYDLRLQLAGRGLPNSSTVGFELFDRSSFSASDLQNNVNYQRALQGELERTITAMKEVSTARVHLALPEERLFTDEQEQATASVVLGLKGAVVSPSQVSAITQLVASAVPNLEPDAVTVVDTAGRLLAGGWDPGGGLQTLAQLQARRAWEERLREYLQSMLDAVLGRHKSVVRVQAELDFESQQLSRESLLSPTDQKMVTHEEITQESYTGRGGETGGPAGLTSTGAREVSRSGGSYEHKSEVREYQYSRDVEQISKPPGQLQRLTVAVAVDDQLEAGAEEKVRELVTAAAGINPERGDQVTVQSIAIDALKRAEEEEKLASSMEAADAHSRSLRIGLRYGSFLVMALMMGAALLMFSRRLSALSLAAPTGGATGTTTGADDGEEAAVPPMTVEELRRSVEQDEASTEHAGADDTEDTLVAELSSLGAETPEAFARKLRGWINPDDFEGE